LLYIVDGSLSLRNAEYPTFHTKLTPELSTDCQKIVTVQYVIDPNIGANPCTRGGVLGI